MLEKQFVTETHEERLGVLAGYRGLVQCPHCRGSRLRPEANFVRVGGKNDLRNLLPVGLRGGSVFRESAGPTNLQPVATPLVASRSASGSNS
jgi:excinuclease UvrABC ATPase subunit